MNDDTSVSLSFSEITNKNDLTQIIGILAKYTSQAVKDLEQFDLTRRPYGNNLSRSQDFMKQKVFNEIHS